MNGQAKLLYEFGCFQLDADERVLRSEGAPVPLPPKAFDILLVLINHRGHIVEKEALLKAAWPDAFVEEGNLAVNVSLLRKVLGDDRQDGNRCIETVPRRGYRFVAEVVEIRKEPAGGESVRGDLTCPPQVEPAAAAAAPGRRSRQRMYGLFVGLALIAVVALAVRPQPRLSPAGSRQITHDGRNKGGPIVTDGSRLYFTEDVDGEHRPSEVLVSGGETAAVPTPLHNLLLSDISPDGSELLGTVPSGAEADAQLWAVPVLGGSPRRLGSLHGRSATWSPDGRKIAYLLGSGLFVAASDGSEAHQIASPPKGYASWPRWSPRGDSLRLVIQNLPGGGSPTSLWEISTDGTKRQQLLTGWNPFAKEREGNWTIDGKWFVFGSERNGHEDIWALREPLVPIPWMSDEPIQLTSGPVDFDASTPSKDGKQVFAIGEQEVGELSRYDAAHKTFEPYLSGVSAMWVSFTRDGRWIAYVKYPDRTLWRVRADGTDRKQLTFAPTQVSGYSWSPDGTHLAICEPWKIGLVARDGGQIDYPVSSSRSQGIPTWSPDGSQLVFGDVPAVYRKTTEPTPSVCST